MIFMLIERLINEKIEKNLLLTDAEADIYLMKLKVKIHLQ